MDTVRIKRYGKTRTYALIPCTNCKKDFAKRASFLVPDQKNFCTRRCRDAYASAGYIEIGGKKKCRACLKIKIAKDGFYKRKASIDGYTSRCRKCTNTDPHRKKVDRLRRVRLRDELSVKSRKYHIARTYKITLEEYDRMLQVQGGVCAICEKSESRRVLGKIVPLSVDHDHKTTAVRGLLCNSCNVGLSRFRDSVEILKAAIGYVRKHSK